MSVNIYYHRNFLLIVFQDCSKEGMEDRPKDGSAFGASNVLYGPFAPRYRRIEDDLGRQMRSKDFILFGDQLLDATILSRYTTQYQYDKPSTSSLPFNPGRTARQKEKDRLGRDRRRADDESDEDWFDKRQERPVPDRHRSNGRERTNHDSSRSYERRRDYDRARNRDELLNFRRSDHSRSGYRSNDRPPSPKYNPPPLPPSRSAPAYPSPRDMAAGYRMSDKPTPSGSRTSYNDSRASNDVSIRGAANRAKEARNYDNTPSGGVRAERDQGGRASGSSDRPLRLVDRLNPSSYDDKAKDRYRNGQRR
jgi:hypothetical protein